MLKNGGKNGQLEFPAYEKKNLQNISKSKTKNKNSLNMKYVSRNWLSSISCK